jgi:hypothetical protein
MEKRSGRCKQRWTKSECINWSLQEFQRWKENQESTFEVEDILEERRNSQGAHELLIKWKGWASEFNSWEPVENLDGDLAEILEALHKKTRKKRKRTSSTSKNCNYLNWEVLEEILDEKLVNGQTFYLVKWKGIPIESSSWEPRENLLCDEALLEQTLIKAKAFAPTNSQNNACFTYRIESHICDKQGNLEALCMIAVSKLTSTSFSYWLQLVDARRDHPLELMEYLMNIAPRNQEGVAINNNERIEDFLLMDETPEISKTLSLDGLFQVHSNKRLNLDELQDDFEVEAEQDDFTNKLIVESAKRVHDEPMTRTPSKSKRAIFEIIRRKSKPKASVYFSLRRFPHLFLQPNDTIIGEQ